MEDMCVHAYIHPVEAKDLPQNRKKRISLSCDTSRSFLAASFCNTTLWSEDAVIVVHVSRAECSWCTRSGA
jgi:hypothetical protein